MSDPADLAPPSGPVPGGGRRPRVVICGAGFGGLWAAKALAGREVEVTLLDRNNYHTFFPLLYQVAAAEIGPTGIAYPVRSILRRARNVTFRMAELERVDTARRRVETSTGPLDYDHLVLALGSEPNFFGVEGADRYAFPLRWMDQAIPLRHHILSRLERSAFTPYPEERRRDLTFVIVGGGPTGVEYAGALAELLHGPVLRDYPGIDSREFRVVLIEAMDRVLGGFPEEASRYAEERLDSRHVEVALGTLVERVGPTSVELSTGETIATETVVWTAGVRGSPRVAEWGLPIGRGGRVRVDETLQVEGCTGVYVVGDLAYLEDGSGEPYTQVAQVAMQQGERAAENILREAAGESPRPFEYRDYGILAVIGRNAAVAHLAGRTFTGFPAWILWLLIHITKLIGFRNRLIVLVNWAWNYLSYEKAVRLILPGREPDGGDGSDRR